MNEGLIGSSIGREIAKNTTKKKRLIIAAVISSVMLAIILFGCYLSYKEQQPIGEPFTALCVFKDAKILSNAQGIFTGVEFDFKNIEDEKYHTYSITEYYDRDDVLINGKECVKNKLIGNYIAPVFSSNIPVEETDPNDIGVSVKGTPMLIGDTCTLTLMPYQYKEEIIDIIVNK